MKPETFSYLTAVEIFLLSPDEKQVLLIHRSMTKDYLPDYYAGLGGKMDAPGLETPHEAILREIREESGYQAHEIENLRLKGIITVQDRFGKWNVLDFTARAKTKKFETGKAIDEGVLEWVDRSQADGLNLIQDLRNGVLERIISCSGFLWMRSSYNDRDELTDLNIEELPYPAR